METKKEISENVRSEVKTWKQQSETNFSESTVSKTVQEKTDDGREKRLKTLLQYKNKLEPLDECSVYSE